MVHTMRRRRVEHVLQPAELGDPLGMDPELVEQVQGQRRQHDLGLKSQQRERREEDGRARCPAHPSKTVGSREIELVRRMMHRVAVPEVAHGVAAAMEPVVEEFQADEEQSHVHRAVEVQGEQPMPEGPGEHRRRKHERKKREELASGEIGQRAGPRLPVEGALPVAEHDAFADRRHHHDRQDVQVNALEIFHGPPP